MPFFTHNYIINNAALEGVHRIKNIDSQDLVYQLLYTIDSYESARAS
jgi:hypothetical protein